MSDRWRLRSLGVVIAIAIVGWSAASVGCVIDLLNQPTADELKRVIEDPDWDSVR